MKKILFLFIVSVNIIIYGLNIVTSIKPLELITKELAPDSTITSLFKTNSDFSKKYSITDNVDLVILLNDEIKTPENIQKVVLSEGVLFYPYNENPFLWTDPLYSVVIAYKIEKKLEKIDPENAMNYRNNLLEMTQKLISMSDNFAKIVDKKQLKVIDLNGLLIHFYKRYKIQYETPKEDYIITASDTLVTNVDYHNLNLKALPNLKIKIDVFATNYSTLIDFYESIFKEFEK
ncbi:hypothetical protein XO10_03455 [Marinitoga sp. 1135]|uniref:ABC-type metal ion transport system, periplasmic component/surface adhesin n=1 Tax=Marinitoga piezophila (strain DSM 14283 / JCM 11233 / KA3) TaxID=443254 RepID=H2J658_MARPK|nr:MULTISPECIES: zinc ABC transporter substrate-binding protein [Marinitoga]AEX85119.1 ABC-type metal ion transport system, periplasmic component/surface adhesin [Marinitoga piezophila KA3]APT75621.1 hypothetical protein LN42_03855 [Marinitoga sp. 1137]NUU95331.1 hypothetical protein [Marinitoga sp. 1135]NUU97265.1 hypothetical protein [Marinitoga sp. 1138]